jgi:hypothetical protein
MNDPTDRLARLEQTRRSLHAVAELLLAGPQFEQSKSIELHVTPGGFGTTRPPDLRVDGSALAVGDRRVDLNGRTIAELADEAGVSARSLRDVYADGPDLDESMPLVVDDVAALEIARAFELGDTALARLAPERKRVLWPEHFDVGIDVDEVNYGVSPGDATSQEPYAYVGPWTFAERTVGSDPFWNTSFGASRTMRELGDLEGVLAFFVRGRDLS